MPMNDKLLQLYTENPSEFRRVMAEAYKKTVIPHAGQQLVLDSQARFRIMNCGRRWGKTVLAAKIITTKARKSNQMLWWVAPTYRIVKRGYVEVIKQLPAGSLVKSPPPATNFDAGRAVVLEFKNGTTMEFYSAERPEGMLGAAVDFCVLDEAARIKPDVWDETISPTLIDHLGNALIISTPRGRNWFYYEWLKGQASGDPDYASWTFRTMDNPTLPPGEAEKMAARMSKTRADQEIYAKWLAAGSSVFLLDEKCMDDRAVKPHGLVEDSTLKGHQVFLGVDLARTNDWTVLYGETDEGENCFFERMQDVAWAEQRRRIRRAVAILRRAGATGVTLMVDEGNGQTTTIEDLQDSGYDAIGINFTTKKAPMVRLLANDLERGATKVLNDPEYGVLEFENYAMDVTEAGRYKYSAPEGQHDDVVSAKMMAHWGAVNEGVGSVYSIDPEGPADDAPKATPTSPQSEDTDPWGDQEDFEGEDWSDLVDDDPDLDDPRAAAAAIGLVAIDLNRPPTPQELLLRDELWG